MQTSYTSFERILRIVMFVAIVLITITMVYPFWYVIIYALSDSNAAIEGSVLLWPLKPTLAVFHRLMGMKMLWTSYGNSIFVTFLDTVDNSQINVLTQRTMHRICTAATNEEVSFAYRVAIPRQRFRWRNAFSTRWRSL